MVMGIAAIVVLFALAGALYGASATLFPGTRPAAAVDDTTGSLPGADENAAVSQEGQWSSFSALSASSDSPAVKAWMADKKVIYVAGISSDFCVEGLSDTWTITYASDDGQVVASVNKGEAVDVRPSTSSPQQGLDPGKVIDSEKAWQAVAASITAAGETAPMTVSMSLKIIGGKPRWDVSYVASGGYRIVRVDAVDGTVSESMTVGQG
jgi:hypothetical protein